jgi:hypothetical protein
VGAGRGRDLTGQDRVGTGRNEGDARGGGHSVGAPSARGWRSLQLQGRGAYRGRSYACPLGTCKLAQRSPWHCPECARPSARQAAHRARHMRACRQRSAAQSLGGARALAMRDGHASWPCEGAGKLHLHCPVYAVALVKVLLESLSILRVATTKGDMGVGRDERTCSPSTRTAVTVHVMPCPLAVRCCSVEAAFLAATRPTPKTTPATPVAAPRPTLTATVLASSLARIAIDVFVASPDTSSLPSTQCEQ